MRLSAVKRQHSSSAYFAVTEKNDYDDVDDAGIVVLASYQTSNKCVQALYQFIFLYTKMGDDFRTILVVPLWSRPSPRN